MRVKCLETYSVDLRTPARFIIPSCTKNSLRIVERYKKCSGNPKATCGG